MPITLTNGSFYRFDRAKKGDEIGSSVSRNNAVALQRRKITRVVLVALGSTEIENVFAVDGVAPVTRA